MKTIEPQLGLGVYSIADVARYVEMSPSTTRSWFKVRDSKNKPALQSDFGVVNGDFSVSFLDLIDTLRVRDLRREGVKMTVIRQSYQILAGKLDTKHPFAHSQIYTDGREVLVAVVDEIGDSTLETVVTRQGFFPQLRKWLKQISFDPNTQLAKSWSIFKGVVIDPKLGFGSPTVVGTGTNTRVVASMYQANERDAALIAELYEMSEEDVLNAVHFEDKISRKRVA